MQRTAILGAVAIFCALTGAPQSRAAVIWSVVQNVSGDADVLAPGESYVVGSQSYTVVSTVGAFNIGAQDGAKSGLGTPATSLSVNDVLFTAWNPATGPSGIGTIATPTVGATDQTHPDNRFQLTNNGVGTYGISMYGGDNRNATAVSGGYSANYKSLLNTSGYVYQDGTTNPADFRINVTGLDPAKTYVFQGWSVDNNNGNNGRTNFFEEAVGGASSGDFVFGAQTTPLVQLSSQFAVGAFTSDASGNFSVVLKGRAGNGYVPILNAFSVSEVAAVPEPSTLTLGAMGLVGMLLAWRRRRSR